MNKEELKKRFGIDIGDKKEIDSTEAIKDGIQATGKLVIVTGIERLDGETKEDVMNKISTILDKEVNEGQAIMLIEHECDVRHLEYRAIVNHFKYNENAVESDTDNE